MSRTCCMTTIILVVFLILTECFTHTTATSHQPSFNPYSVLGVPQSATLEEIKRQYRKLCLQYHPDKNVHKSPKERKKCEDAFKNIQNANALIGDEESRRRYDYERSLQYSFPQQGHHSRSSPGSHEQRQATSGSSEYYNDILRRYYQYQSTPTFSFGGVPVSNFFPSGSAAWMPRPHSGVKSSYVQKVKLPLQDLYNGKYGVDLILRDSLWNRYCAAFRGGMGMPLLYQSIMISISMLRVVRFPWSLLIGAFCFHLGLPKPMKLDYLVDLQAGWKAGTKLKFCEVEPGFDVVFVIEEEKHETYQRVGNDLFASVIINETERRQGCTVKLASLHHAEGTISINLEPNQIRHSGESIVLTGKGWPGRNGKKTGDLLVFVEVKNRSPRKSKRREARP